MLGDCGFYFLLSACESKPAKCTHRAHERCIKQQNLLVIFFFLIIQRFYKFRLSSPQLQVLQNEVIFSAWVDHSETHKELSLFFYSFFFCPWLILWPSLRKQHQPRKRCLYWSQLRPEVSVILWLFDWWGALQAKQPWGGFQVWGWEVVSSRMPQTSPCQTESCLGVLVKLYLKTLVSPRQSLANSNAREACQLWGISYDSY